MEAHVGILSRLFSAGAVDATFLARTHGSSQNSRDGLVQLLAHLPFYDGVADIVAQIERSDEDDVDKRGDLLNRLQRFLGLYLHNGKETVVRVLQVLCETGHWRKVLQRNGRAKAALPQRRELGGSYQGLGFLDGANQRDDDLDSCQQCPSGIHGFGPWGFGCGSLTPWAPLSNAPASKRQRYGKKSAGLVGSNLRWRQEGLTDVLPSTVEGLGSEL